MKFWEPGAPRYEERKAALQYAWDAGYATSISCEPMLDAHHIDDLVNDLMPSVTETMWLGKINNLGRIQGKSPELDNAIAEIRASQSDAKILAIYRRLQHHPQIRWKDSIKKVISKNLNHCCKKGGVNHE